MEPLEPAADRREMPPADLERVRARAELCTQAHRHLAVFGPVQRVDFLHGNQRVAVDADGNVYAAEGPNSLSWAGGAFTKYEAR